MAPMIFLVDGYNVTKSDPATRDATLEEQRAALLARLRARGRDLLGGGRIVVVFDARGGPGPSQGGGGGIEVVFERGGTADDAIERLARSAKEPVCLVSSDRQLAGRVTAHSRYGVDVRSGSVLYDDARPARPRRSGRSRADLQNEFGVPSGGNSITRELEGIWLDEKE
ncbi:MAG: NYN domain-containing protein [Coriobacteriia bacterium]|nr:NYN domain-containing protein [Coriobacteriia bacterium]